MSAAANATVGHHVTEYRVLVREGCTFIFGAMPLDHVIALTEGADKRLVVDSHLARLGKATMAWGLPEDCKAMAERLATAALESAPLATALQRWLAVGQRGSSSNAIVAHLRGVQVGGYDRQAHPHNPDDLHRCLMLLEDVPELAADFYRMASLSETWARLVKHWEAIKASFLAEAGADWRKSRWSAPKTYALMRTVIEGKA